MRKERKGMENIFIVKNKSLPSWIFIYLFSDKSLFRENNHWSSNMYHRDIHL